LIFSIGRVVPWAVNFKIKHSSAGNCKIRIMREDVKEIGNDEQLGYWV
jgi:hypothetical protein